MSWRTSRRAISTLAADVLTLATTALTPQHPGVVRVSDQLREATARQAAAEAAERLQKEVADLIAGASQRLQGAGDRTNELALALRDVKQALALDAGNAEAASLQTSIEASIATHREAARVKALINNARTRFANGKHHAAIRLLEEFQPASHPEIEPVLAELRAALSAIEEQRRVERERIEAQERLAAVLGEARTALQDDRFDAALAALSTAGQIDAAAPELLQLTEQVQRAQTTARLNAELDAVLAGLAERLASGDLTGANDRLGKATALAPADSRVLAAKQRIEQASAARDAAAARAQDLEAKQTAAEASFD